MVEEEAVFLYDLRLARRWKRRRIAYENGGLNSCSNMDLNKTEGQNNRHNDTFPEARTVDSDYVNVSNDMEGSVDFDAGCVNNAAAGSDDNAREVFDPDYMMFLNNLKEDGESYVLELALGEILIVVKYEKEDNWSNELDMENWETSKRHSEQWKAGNENVLKSCWGRERVEISRRAFWSNSSKQETESLRMNCRSNADAEATENTQNVLFCNSWKRKTENPSKNWRSESKRKYNQNPSILHDVVKRLKMEIPRTLRSNSRREDNEWSRILLDAEIARMSRVSMGTQTNLRELGVEKNVDQGTEDPILSAGGNQDLVDESYGEFLKLLEDGEHLNCTFDGGKKVTYEESDSENVAEDHSQPSRRHSLEVTNSPKHHCNPGVNSKVADEGYLEFLKSLKDGEHLSCTCDGGKRIMYEESNSEKVTYNHSLLSRRHSPEVINSSNSSKQETESLKMDCKGNADAEKTENTQDVLSTNSWRRKTENPSTTLRSEPERKHNENPSILHDVVERVKMDIPKTLRNNSRIEDNECSRIFQDAEIARTSRVSKGTRTNLREPVAEKNVDKETEDPILSASSNQDLADESYGEFLKLLEDGEHLNCAIAGGKKVTYEESDSENVAEDHSLPSRRHSPEVTNLPKHQCNPGENSDLADEGYLEFLKSLKDGEHLECTLGGKRVIYEENDYDSEVTILEDNPFSDGKCISIVDVDGEKCIETPGSEFREQLMDILQKPYDRMEYEKLWKEASLQKPLEGQRVLRSQTISYRLDAKAKSYLERDGYSDLVLVVDQARGDQRRILNLLRGFFYWLQLCGHCKSISTMPSIHASLMAMYIDFFQKAVAVYNLAHKGAFKPWLDSWCSCVLPPVEPGTFASGSDREAKCAVQAIKVSDCKPQDLAS